MEGMSLPHGRIKTLAALTKVHCAVKINTSASKDSRD